MKEIACKLLVIGAGPGGYVAAIRAGQLGIDTVIVEATQAGRHLPDRRLHPVQGADPCGRGVREGRRHGGRRHAARHLARRQPTLDLAQHRRLEGRHRRAADQRRRRRCSRRPRSRPCSGWARFRDGKTVEVETETGVQVIRAEHVVIATGSVPVELPFAAVRRHRDLLDRSAGADRACRRRLAVVGAGYIGLELGIAFAKLGAAVTVVEAAGAHPAALRCRADPAGRQAPAPSSASRC